jgi:hypothetical protein
MNKLVIIGCCVVSMIFTGCKTLPSVEKMETTSQAIGYTAGLVANNVSINDEQRNIIVDIINKVKDCTPTNQQTFVSAWTPVATEYVKDLVVAGKIKEREGVLILKVFDIVANGMDYVFDNVYPKAREYENLVTAAIRGFTNGFLTTFKPVNRVFNKNIKFDKDAYEYLMDVL